MGREPADNSSLSYRYSGRPRDSLKKRGLVKKVDETFIDSTWYSVSLVVVVAPIVFGLDQLGRILKYWYLRVTRYSEKYMSYNLSRAIVINILFSHPERIFVSTSSSSSSSLVESWLEFSRERSLKTLAKFQVKTDLFTRHNEMYVCVITTRDTTEKQYYVETLSTW